MRLYLSSYRMGGAFASLLAMAGQGARTAVVSNALDFIPLEDRQAYARNVHDPVAEFRAHGLEAEPLDLRDYFGRQDEMHAALAGYSLVWAVGGNAFLLMRAMRQSGFDQALARLAAQDAIIYGGWSAGAVVAGPSLRGLDLMDDPHVLAEGYDPEPPWEGLGLIDRCIVPHFRSDHAEAGAAERAVAAMEAQGLPYLALRDGEVLICDADETRIVRAST